MIAKIGLTNVNLIKVFIKKISIASVLVFIKQLRIFLDR